MKNYNQFSKKQESVKEEKKNFTEKLKEKLSLVDQAENIKEQIQKREEEIQTLKNSISVYFVNKCKFVNLREEPDKKALVLDILENGSIIEPVIYNDTTEWTKIKYKNKTGYMMTKFIGVEVSEPVE